MEVLRKRKSKNPSRWTEESEKAYNDLKEKVEAAKAEEILGTNNQGISIEEAERPAPEKKIAYVPAKGTDRVYHIRVKESGKGNFDPITGEPVRAWIIYMTPSEFNVYEGNQSVTGTEIVEILHDPTKCNK